MTPTSNPNELTLSPEQQLAVGFIGEWFHYAFTPGHPNIFRLGGYAGTGKTTLIRSLIRDKRFRSVAVCAFTGKAADVLTRKGVTASTIHSLIYNCSEDPVTHELKVELKSCHQLDFDLIIVDEASMVSTEIYGDLVSFSIPILFIGDPGQLEPIGDNPNLMRDPNYTLTHIHRQALESPIIGLATAIRAAGPNGAYRPQAFGSHPPQLSFITKQLKGELLASVDQIICGTNKTRMAVNQRCRIMQGHSMQDGLHKDEKIMCLRNNTELGVFNGQLMWIADILEETSRCFNCLVRVDGREGLRELKLWSEPYYRPIDPKERIPKEYVHSDFGYCITTHKSQGSEWDSVLVIDEWMPPKIWDMTRWRYTAITRAAKQLNFAA